ncbi:MAG: alpha/beta hydrolase-fold protein, partial [Solirubrobacteraceae bacterium]
MRLRAPQPLVILLSVALAATGLWGCYRYWESYFQHRGFTVVAYLPHARRGTLETIDFYSAALRRRADYLVYLPAEYGNPRRRFPVYYLLHGSPGRPQVFLGIANEPVRMDNLVSQGRMRPMILVFPDGRIGGSTYSDSEWADTPSGNYAGYVIDVVRDVDRRFRTLANRRDRVIAGFSAGAYGATNIALHNLGVFAGLQSWSGYYLETRSGVFARASASTLADNSPLDYVDSLPGQLAADPLRAFLFVGRDDDDSPQTMPMAEALARAGASVSYALYRGGHDWQLWHAHLDQMLILASQDTVEPLPRATGVARTLTPGVVPIPHGLGRRRRHPARRSASARRHRVRHGRRRRRSPQVNLVLSRFVRRRTGPPPGPGPAAGARARAEPRPRQPRPRGRIAAGALTGGLLLALVSAALINLGFLLQHRGLRGADADRWTASLRAGLRDRFWLAGQLLGWLGFGAQIVAVALAPLALVQAFAAGGLALSVPLAAAIVGHRVQRGPLLAVLAIAAALATLPIGFSTARDQLSTGALI